VRLSRLALPLAVLFALVPAAPAAAMADYPVTVISFEFQPGTRAIAVGDTVTWHFTAAGHTTTSLHGQPDSWDSTPQGASSNSTGDVFTHQFNTPGRYQYVCIPHREFMKGVIVVGTDTVTTTVSRFRTSRHGHRATISFKLNEPATVKYTLRGPSKKTVKKGRLLPGKHSFSVKRLKKGSYKGVLTAVDDFDKKATKSKSFVVP
jgi:plastocyanin